MIALPVLALTAVDVLARSAQLDPDESLARKLGATQARIEVFPGPVIQQPDPGSGDGWVPDTEAEGKRESNPSSTADLIAALPSRATVLTSQQGEVVARTGAGLATARWEEVLAGDASLAGRFRHVDGRAPRTRGEVAVTSEMLDRLGSQVGATVVIDDPTRSFTITGVYDEVGSTSLESFWARPGTLLGRGVEAFGPPTLYVADQPIRWDTVLELNQRGGVVLSRTVVQDPPPDSDVPYFARVNGGRSSGDTVLVLLLMSVIVVLAGLEVTLLAGAAFAVGARRQARTLGLVSVAGGSPAVVRRIVLAGGLVLGVVGAAVGMLLGVLLAAGATPTLEHWAGEEFGRFDVRPLELLAIAGVGIVTGLLAAVLPARTASRRDPVVALTGRRGQVRTPRKVPLIGLVLVGLGAGATAVGSALAVALTAETTPSSGAMEVTAGALVAGGAALAQIGLIITSPAIIGLAERLSARLPLAWRLALRDTARHRGRSAPAMAAILTAVTGSTALLIVVSATDAYDRDSYQPSWPTGTAGMGLVDYESRPATGKDSTTLLDPDDASRALAGALPPFTSHVVTTTDVSCFGDVCSSLMAVVPPGNECFLWKLDRVPTDAERTRAARDSRCDEMEGRHFASGVEGSLVGGVEVLRQFVGDVPAGARDVLSRGGVVVTDRALLVDGQVQFDSVSRREARAAAGEDRKPVPTRVSVPAFHLRPAAGVVGEFYSKGAAEAIGMDTVRSALLLEFDRLPTGAEEDAARDALQNAALPYENFSVERGYVSEYGLGLLALIVGSGVITLGAAGIATGLAQADARDDHATLAAVGAAPRIRRTLAAAQAWSIAVLGTALGIAAGFVPAVGLVSSIEEIDLVVPWTRLATVFVVIPLLAGVLAWLLTRSRVPLERRIS